MDACGVYQVVILKIQNNILKSKTTMENLKPTWILSMWNHTTPTAPFHSKLNREVSFSSMALSSITLNQTPLKNRDMLILSISLRVITNTPKITGSEDKEMKYVRESHSENANGERIYVKEKGGHVKWS